MNIDLYISEESLLHLILEFRDPLAKLLRIEAFLGDYDIHLMWLEMDVIVQRASVMAFRLNLKDVYFLLM